MYRPTATQRGTCEICHIAPCGFEDRVGDLLCCTSCRRAGPQFTCVAGCGAPVWHADAFCGLDCLGAHTGEGR
jgi:hypothetical protein